MYEVQKVRGNVYYVKSSKANYIIKTFNCSKHKKIIHDIKGGKATAFENELRVYQSLQNKTFKIFKYPNLVKTDGQSYIVIEYISGNNGWDKNIISNEKLISSLLEFQFSNAKTESNFIKNIMINYHRRIPYKIIRWSPCLIKTPFDVIDWIKCNLILLRCSLCYRGEHEGLFTHNDLFRCNNIISGNDGNMYFYDFEYALYEKKWFLIDIFDLVFNMEKCKIDVELLKEYIKQFSCKLPFAKCECYLEKQTRIILLRKLLGVIISKKVKEDNKKCCRIFIKNILLSDKKYEEWYEENIVSAYK